jgi:hypothetical protein
MLIAIVNGPDGEQVSEFEDQSIVLGRHGTFRLNDRKVSKQHARLQSDGSAWYVEDMGSKNGTFVNGVRVVRPCRVKEGDRLRLGQTQVVLSKLSAPEGLHAPRMQVTAPPPPAPAVAAPPPVAPPSVDPPARPDVREESGFLTLSAGDLLESAEFSPAQLDLEVPSLDLEEPAPSPVEDVVPAADVVPAEAVAPAVDVARPDDVGPVEDVTAHVAPVEDVAAVEAAAPFEDAPPAEIAAESAPIEDAAPEPETIPVQNLPEATVASDADLAPPDLDPAPLEAAFAPDDVAAVEEPRADESPSNDLAPTPDAVDPTTGDDAQPSWAVELPPVATPPADVPEMAAAAETSQAVAEEQGRDSFDEQSSPKAHGTEAPADRGISKPDHTPASAPDDDESLAAFMNVLPQRRPGKQLTRFDEAILSIRPLALREELAALQAPPVSPWRRSIPYAMLSLVLLAVIANLALLMMFRRDASRDAAALQESLRKQQQMSAELVLQEVREELRAPVAQNAQAIQALGDSVLAKQEAIAEKLQAQLAAATTAATKQPAAAAPEDDQSRRAAEESRAALMRELNEIKTALADMRKATAPPAPPAQLIAPAPSAAPSGAAPSAAARGDEPNAESRTPAGEASAAPAAAVIAPRKGYAQSFVIDASGALQNSIPDAVAEVRRAIETARSNGNVRILLLYQGRLIELPPAALTTPGTAEPIDRGEADLAAAVKAALKDRPVVLNLLSDTLGGGDVVSAVLRQADMSGTSVNVTQFFARNGREQLKSLAREFHGTYGYVPPRGQ